MRILYIRLKGYVGIYNGLGLNEIELDLSKSKHKITVISGINGCGKTTLLKAASVLPDDSSCFIPGVPAEKELKVADEDNIYDILITSAAAKNGRGLSKASFIKNGIQLNPNGNIGSYKEIVFQEFDLDSNFIALSRLSSDDRGLADKSPAERKKFMSFIVDSLETYNAIYKNLNKKSSIFKSYVNNLHTKIQNIGDENVIRGNLTTLETRRNNILQSIKELNSLIIELQTVLSLNDPNGTLQSQYETYDNLVKDLSKSANNLNREFVVLCRGLQIEPTMESLMVFMEQTNGLLETHERNLDDSNRKKLSLIEKKESITTELTNKKMKIRELESSINTQLRDTIFVIKKKVQEELRILNSIGVQDPDNTSKEEIQHTFDTIKMIVKMIEDNLYYEANETMLQYTLSWDSSVYRRLQEEINNETLMITDINMKLLEARKDAELISILGNRPKGCKIDDCYFINSAYTLQNTKYNDADISSVINSLETELQKLEESLEGKTIESEQMQIISEKKVILDKIISEIERNRIMLSKYTIGQLLLDTYIDRITHMKTFNEFKDMDRLIEQINTITLYRRDSETLRNLESEYKAQSNIDFMLNQLQSEIEILERNLNEVNRSLSSISNEIYNYTSIIENLKVKCQTANKAKDKGDIWCNEELKLSEAKANLDEITRKSKESISILEKISNSNTQISQLQTQIEPLESQIAKINGQLLLLEQYKAEYQQYSDKYNLITTLKKYSSPTEGIQTLFMSIYMNKTLELANRVLGMIFAGQYRILDYIINANEFRIPFVGLGMTVDDISSGSTSQVCMMGMVMNLVLLYQASTKYNITRLDEIDGGLDTRNRLEFVNVLYRVIDILGIDQLFIISHSLELELSNVDLIVLKTYEDFNDFGSGANVLYDFKNQH
ncbi:MAG: hypothetical protein NC548_15825 [Lachnospiraceae bacterium]|nr:hypothetical protein [Lachnospiraceae bacterium]